MVKMNFGHKRL